MATVYLADDLKHERNVALKVLKPELAAVVGAEHYLAEIKSPGSRINPSRAGGARQSEAWGRRTPDPAEYPRWRTGYSLSCVVE